MPTPGAAAAQRPPPGPGSLLWGAGTPHRPLTPPSHPSHRPWGPGTPHTLPLGAWHCLWVPVIPHSLCGYLSSLPTPLTLPLGTWQCLWVPVIPHTVCRCLSLHLSHTPLTLSVGTCHTPYIPLTTLCGYLSYLTHTPHTVCGYLSLVIPHTHPSHCLWVPGTPHSHLSHSFGHLSPLTHTVHEVLAPLTTPHGTLHLSLLALEVPSLPPGALGTSPIPGKLNHFSARCHYPPAASLLSPGQVNPVGFGSCRGRRRQDEKEGTDLEERIQQTL